MRRWLIGSRGSRLALWQAEHVRSALARHPGLDVQVRVIRTEGDLHADVPLTSVTQRGFFTSRIQQALLTGEVDIAVHSLKDLSVHPMAGLTVAAVTARHDPADALISRDALTLERLPRGATILCSCWRRTSQLLARRPDLLIQPVRGNVDTRLRTFRGNGADAMILALAGLERLGLGDAVTQRLDPADFLPAPGQGALAVEVRQDDAAAMELASALDDAPTNRATTAERAFLAGLGGGCQLPAGAWARSEAGTLVLTGILASRDGATLLRDELRARDASAAGELGAMLARRLLNAGGRAILAGLTFA